MFSSLDSYFALRKNLTCCFGLFISFLIPDVFYQYACFVSFGRM